MSTPSSPRQQLQTAAPPLLLPPPLTMPLARQLVLLSFHLSQGEPTLQQDLFRALAWSHPHWRLSPEVSQALVGLAPAVRKLAERGVHAPFTRPVEEELTTQVAELAEILRRPALKGLEDLLFKLLGGFIRRDHDFLCRRSGRPRFGWNLSSSDSHHDPFFSFVCSYLLLSGKTGCLSYDRILAQMAAALAARGAVFARLKISGFVDDLAEVVVVHNFRHPDAPVVVEGWE